MNKLIELQKQVIAEIKKQRDNTSSTASYDMMDEFYEGAKNTLKGIENELEEQKLNKRRTNENIV